MVDRHNRTVQLTTGQVEVEHEPDYKLEEEESPELKQAKEIYLSAAVDTMFKMAEEDRQAREHQRLQLAVVDAVRIARNLQERFGHECSDVVPAMTAMDALIQFEQEHKP